VLKATVFATVFAIFLSILIGCVEGSEIRLISPIGAAARSIIPGWGQVYTRSKIQGVVVFLSIGLIAGGGARAYAIHQDFYNNRYVPAVLAESDQADFYYDRSNQYFKLYRFLVGTAAGIWAYSALDAYVDAHIYNARQRARILDIDDKGLRQLKQGNSLSKAVAPKNVPLSSFCFSSESLVKLHLRGD